MMKALSGILLVVAMLLANKLTGPSARNEMIYKDQELYGRIVMDPETAYKMDLLINGYTFEFTNNDTIARLTFRNGNFVLSCQSSRSARPEILYGNYFFAKEDESVSPVVVLRRTKADRQINGQIEDPLSLAQQLLSLNTSLEICFNQKPVGIDPPVSPDCLILRGFHVFLPHLKN